MGLSCRRDLYPEQEPVWYYSVQMLPCPHGSATPKRLGPADFVLIDVGGTLHGYHSDISRTFALDNSEIETVDLVAWYAVQSAQLAAHSVAKNGTPTGAVDRAARTHSGQGTLWSVFSHTVWDMVRCPLLHSMPFVHICGIGIGLEEHESPYLVGGSNGTLAVGNVFSNEPGVYIEGRVRNRWQSLLKSVNILARSAFGWKIFSSSMKEGSPNSLPPE